MDFVNVNTAIESVKIIEPQVFGDSRGWFVEQYNAERYKAAGITADFVQDNESFSSKGVVRGLHRQGVALEKMLERSGRLLWFLRKLRGGLKCLEEHGWYYTLRVAKGKINRFKSEYSAHD